MRPMRLALSKVEHGEPQGERRVTVENGLAGRLDAVFALLPTEGMSARSSDVGGGWLTR